MKKPLLVITLVLASAVGWGVAGLYAGFYLSDYDPQCERRFAKYSVKADLISNSGIRVPAGSTVLGRECRSAINLKMYYVVDSQDPAILEKTGPGSLVSYHDEHLRVEETESGETREEPDADSG